MLRSVCACVCFACTCRAFACAKKKQKKQGGETVVSSGNVLRTLLHYWYRTSHRADVASKGSALPCGGTWPSPGSSIADMSVPDVA
eukprot:3034348-Rhodomonas_salina.1